ncbi:phage tail protein, partial [Achromobacter xylosoxidans]
AVWSASRGSHWFSDYSATQFRVPDLRDMFRRFTGTDADTANARVLATRQAQQIQSHLHASLAVGVGDGSLGPGQSSYALY